MQKFRAVKTGKGSIRGQMGLPLQFGLIFRFLFCTFFLELPFIVCQDTNLLLHEFWWLQITRWIISNNVFTRSLFKCCVEHVFVLWSLLRNRPDVPCFLWGHWGTFADGGFPCPWASARPFPPCGKHILQGDHGCEHCDKQNYGDDTPRVFFQNYSLPVVNCGINHARGRISLAYLPVSFQFRASQKGLHVNVKALANGDYSYASFLSLDSR